MPTPIFWTEERLARLEEMYLADATADQMGAEFGKSARACRDALSRFDISSHLSKAARQSRRKQHPKMTKEVRAKISAKAKERFADPERRKVHAAFINSDRSASTRKGWPGRRGFEVPPDKADDYNAMVYSQHFRAPEAAAILGLKPKEKRRKKTFRWYAIEQAR